MARSICTICSHPQVAAINQALTLGKPNQTDLAATFALSRFALSRHRHKCLKRAISKSLERQDLITGASLINDSQHVRAIVRSSLEACAQAANHSAIGPLAGAHVKVSEHIAKLAGLEGYKQPQAQAIAIDARGSRFLIMPQSPQGQQLTLPAPDDTE